MNPKQIEEFFHLTPVQKHLLRQSEQAPPQTHLAQFSCQLEGPLDVSAFERAWQKVTNQQPGLRLAFVSGDLKEPVQFVNRNVGVELEKHDWRNLSEEGQARRLAELFAADRQAGILLKTPPLWRMALVRLDEERYHFVWTYHELLFDERSLPLLFNEALQCYDAILRGQKITLPLPVSFRKYVDWVKKRDPLATEHFWRTGLKGFRHTSPLAPSLPEMVVQVASEKADTLNALAVQHQLAPEVIAYGAWALLLSRLSEQSDVLFGIQVSGRSPQFHGAERLIGHLRNTLPFRVRYAPDAMVLDWLTDLQRQWEDLQHYAHASLAQLHSWSDLPASQPLFENVIVFEAAHSETSIRREVAGVQVQYDSLVTPNHFPLAIMIKDHGAWELTGDAHVKPLCFLLEQFAMAPQRRLAEIVLPAAAPEATAPNTSDTVDDAFVTPLLEIPLHWSTTEEEEQGWVDWLKEETCVHELFEQRVLQTPDAVAVQLQGQSLTYRELNARANQLARYLRKLNVVPSLPVGLCFMPSLEGLVALLGVLKAGGAYLPLDANWEAESLRQIITDSATTILLTHSPLEPQFRELPVYCVVLCLDNDWGLIAEEDADNLARQVSDEHPACFLVEAESPTVITHAQLTQAVSRRPEWFHFGPKNPWHLFTAFVESVPASVSIPVSPLASSPIVAEDNEPLGELASGMDWFDLQPELLFDNGHTPAPPLPPASDCLLEVETLSAVAVNEAIGENVELDVPLDLVAVNAKAAEDFELDVPLNLVAVNEGTEGDFELDVPLDLAEPRPEVHDLPEETLSNFVAPALAPIQQQFLARELSAPHHYNVSLLVEISDKLEHQTLQQALQVVVAHHEALRWRLAETEQGKCWQASEVEEVLPFEYVDFSAKWARSQRKAIEDMADKWQANLHLTTGPLWRAAYFDLGENRSHRLLIIAHQMLADDSSLRLFLQDWLMVYEQLRRAETPSLPPPSASYAEWVRSLAEAASPNEIEYWQRLQSKTLPQLPIDHPNGSNHYGNVDRVFVSLNSKETEHLLQQLPAAAEADINEIVLTALTLALAQWAGANSAWLTLEREARKDLSLDVTRTIGWLTAKFPVYLQAENLTDATAALQAIKTQLRAVPGQGLNYGLWRYNSSAAATLCELPPPQISFKYLTFPPVETAWQLAPEAVGLEHDPQNQRDAVITVTGAMNFNMLEFRWEYAREQLEQRNIGLLVNSFIGELRHLIQQYSQQIAHSGN